MNEEVKKILEGKLVDYGKGARSFVASDVDKLLPKLAHVVTSEICQLFPKSPDNPDGCGAQPILCSKGHKMTKVTFYKCPICNKGRRKRNE